MRRADGTYRYYLFDGLGSVVAMTSTSGGLSNRYAYDPYGNERSTGFTNAFTQPYRYTGQHLDTSTGLYKRGFRYYDPTLGRFTQQDPLGDNPQTREVPRVSRIGDPIG
jgi:RHS repeat-associated protein